MQSPRNSMMQPAAEPEKKCTTCFLRVAHSIKQCPNCHGEDFTDVRDDQYHSTQRDEKPKQ